MSQNNCPAGNSIVFVSPDTPSKCTWKLGDKTQNTVHSSRPAKPRPKILPNILHAIGNTPLIKLNKIPQSFGIKCEMYAKCEFLNPGGSVKDRIGYRMVLDAEEKGLLKPGYTVIEPTSGNTGIGLALACAVKGYNCDIVMPEKMSNEKVDTLKALGAHIVRTPTEAAFDSPDSLISVAHKRNTEIPCSIVLNQYRNSGNPLAHYDGTADEILNDLEGSVDMIVMGAGTGGTVAGVGRKIKEKCPSCVIVAADPEGSILSLPAELNESDVNFYEVEGIGYDFVPTVLDRSVVDKWIKSNDKEALPMARRLIAEEGLLCGGSSGTAMAVALKAAKTLKEGQKCVVILPDGVRNYMTKFISDNWMEARDLKPVEKQDMLWWDNKVSNLNLTDAVNLTLSKSCKETYSTMNTLNLDQIPIVDSTGNLKGVATLSHLMNCIVSKKVEFSDPIEKALFKQFRRVDVNTSLGKVSRILEKEPFVVVVTKSESGTDIPKHIITPKNLMSYIHKFSTQTNGK